MPIFISEPFEVYAGDQWSQSFELGDWMTDESGEYVLDEDGAQIFVPEDVSAWPEWACDWRPDPSSETEIELTVDFTGAASGIIVVAASTAATRAMRVNGKFDIQASDGPENVKTFLVGKTKWRQDVTR